ncbi:acetylxylan esterase [Promicromonospora sukumoe]|uniref:Cephalosporin-C deacetylase n=1 Tax=Promicromonospora sukumoe TaxID=88382 RepID=A0A7W3JD72_9MICO|nr:acetylxylan esterase [Promicromonospora sukumoe]MBA8810685.1 cephalosporin-C deacetylase [Promicromonospora sukumoe]
MPLPEPYATWFPDAPIDGTYGYDRDALLAVEPVPAPAGFAELWQGWFAASRVVRPEPRLTSLGRQGAHDLYEVEHAGADGLRLRGWLALPSEGRARVGVVHGHGYGGRDAPAFDRVPDDAAVVFPVARGLGALNSGVGAPDEAAEHVVHGIGSVATYSLGRCAVDLWHAADALVEVAGDLPLYYVGESFGGIGALALPWDRRFVGATFVVPSFGQYDVRLGLECTGSGEAVRRYVAEHPEARDVLRYFDTSTAAGYLRIPVRCECALWDAAVPPPGQFAVANAVAAVAATRAGGAACPALELETLPAGHADYPGDVDVKARAASATRGHIARCVAG